MNPIELLTCQEISEKAKDILEERGCYDVIVHQVVRYPKCCSVHVSYKWRLDSWEKVVPMTARILVYRNGVYELM